MKNRMPPEHMLRRQLDAAEIRGREAASSPHRVARAWYDIDGERVIVEFANGFAFAMPVSAVPGLDEQPAEVRMNVEVDPLGEGLRWDEADIDVSVHGVLVEAIGRGTLFRYLGQQGGQAKTEAKREAARMNGLKGGRPRQAAWHASGKMTGGGKLGGGSVRKGAKKGAKKAANKGARTPGAAARSAGKKAAKRSPK